MVDFNIFGPFGWNVAAGEPFDATVGIDALNLSGHLGLDMLVIAEPFVTGASGGAEGYDLFPPFGLISTGDWSSTVTTRQTIYVAATRGRSTANDDEPSATHIPGRLFPWNFSARLFSGVDPLQRGDAASGVIRLGDPDGRLDYLIGMNWDSAPITIKRGPGGLGVTGSALVDEDGDPILDEDGNPILSEDYSPGRLSLLRDWETVGVFRSAALIRDLNEKQIVLRDVEWQLDAPLHGITYEGTGGLEGDATLAGQLKPWAIGHCWNIEPVLISVSDQIFQWSMTSSVELTQLLHGAVPLDFNADYPDYASLAAATIPSSEYATCLAESLVRPNITLQYGIRVDVIGDADVVNGHPAPTTRAGIIRRIVTAYGGNALDEDEEIDSSSFQRMDAYHSAPVGFYFGSETTKAAAGVTRS